MNQEQEYAEPRHPAALNGSELDRLRKQVAEAEKAIASPKHQALSFADRTRREQQAKEIRRRLEAAEDRAMSGEQRAANVAGPAIPGPRRAVVLFEPVGVASEDGDQLVRDDSGTMLLNRSAFDRARGQVANAAEVVEFAAPVPYWR